MYIYLTVNLVNGRSYVGRDSTNRRGYLGSGIFLKQAIRKYGRESFERINLERCKDMRHLIEREKFWIAYFDAVRSEEFYNMSEGTGGFGPNDRHTEETKRLISQKCRGRKLTSEQRDKRIQELTGREPWNKGKKLVPGTKEYEKTYRRRKQGVRLDEETMRAILRDYETGEFTFAELSAKYSRTVKHAQIIRIREVLKASTRGA